MAQNQNINEAVNHINTAFQSLALALENIDEVQNNTDSPALRRLRVKRNAVRAIDISHLLNIPHPFLTVEFYNNLRGRLEIVGEVQHGDIFGQEIECRSPQDLASVLVANGDATAAAVIKLFEKQYELRWRTDTGDPDQFSFYGFCQDVVDARGDADGENVMTYDTRRAHVISRLYHAQEKLHRIRHLSTYRQLCPPVYVRTGKDKNWTWTKWICNDGGTFVEEGGQGANIDWITNVPLRDYITENSKLNVPNEQGVNGNLPNGVQEHLYWAVLEEDDFVDPQPHADIGNNLGRTQVYVGKAERGIKDRWAGSQNRSHCKKMELSRNVMYNIMNYDQNTLEGEQLVNLRFLLHKADYPNGANCGLFIMNLQGYGDYGLAKTGNINNGIPLQVDQQLWQLSPKDMKFGMNK